MSRVDILKTNEKAWKKWSSEKFEWTIPIGHNDYINAKNGNWEVTLATDRKVPHEWFPELNNLAVLGLAAGGGQQIPIFAAQGAKCTVLDLCEDQLEKEIEVARREGYEVKVVHQSMNEYFPFEDGAFDLIFHPASNTYVESIDLIWRECYRVLKRGGVLLCGLDYGPNFLFYESGEYPPRVTCKLPFSPLKDLNEVELEQMIERDDCIQFSHSIEEQIGGQLSAGFILTNILEDRNKPGHGVVRDFTSQYLLTRAIKP